MFCSISVQARPVGQASLPATFKCYTPAVADELEIRRRRLPHWNLKGSTYFITWHLADIIVPLNDAEKQLVVNALLHFNQDRYRLLSYVVMDDHVHLVARPLGDHTMDELLHSWKSYTASMINKMRKTKGTLWQDERFDRLIRDENELMQKMYYVITNPSRKWPGMHDYKYVGWFSDG